ncbi:MAG TPA: hypothetical protein VL361_24395 [Candidatus Limnocylindrales bacterium]|nr:hypothetical protein [Candidatus Limnocylindrales bacterium]
MNSPTAIPKWRLVKTICFDLFLLSTSFAATAQTVSIIVSDRSAKPVEHGVSKLKATLQQRGASLEEVGSVRETKGQLIVVAGIVGSASGEATKLLAEKNVSAPKDPESLLIRRFNRGGKTVVLIAGADPRGLMYGLLEVAERVGWATSTNNPFSEVRDADEKPYAPERALSIYTFNRDYWESRFFDEAYWSRYLDMLAENRFDSLVVIFGYENGGFLAPCYPYFFEVEGFQNVRMVGITPEEQRRNLGALNRLIGMAHDRGIRFTVGIWDHIYRGGVQGGGIPGADEGTRRPVPGLVWGVTGENLVSYTKAALAKFVGLVPNLDAIQFRMHDESGLKNNEQGAFWRDVFLQMKQKAPRLRLDLRAKGLPDSVIDTAREVGVPFRITTKFWMEQMGLPFHPTHINRENQFDRRHSYADMLRYPQLYKMHWRLWNGGTARVLLWADPDYARRFAESSHLYDGDGFEVNEPLCTKMEGQPHDSKPFELLSPAHRYYTYEFERYWHFFQVFGRIGYDTNAAPEIWEHEFEQRFGKAAGPHIEQALHHASRVLPRIVASCYPYSAFPMTRGWAEKQRLGNLPQYAKAEGSDIQQFASFDEEARLLIEGAETAKVRPAANSDWFSRTADEITASLAKAQGGIGTNGTKEFESTVTDLKILANLALFHSRRIPAAVNYRLFERTKDPQALAQAITDEQKATAAWRQMVRAAGDFYADDLKMGVRTADLCGHWKDELVALEKGVAVLQQQLSALQPSPGSKPAPRFTGTDSPTDKTVPQVIHQPITSAAIGTPITISAEVRTPAGVKWVRVQFRSVNQHQDFRSVPMLPSNKEKNRYEAVISAQEIEPKWDLMYFIEAMGKDGNGCIYPDLNRETPYVVVSLKR